MKCFYCKNEIDDGFKFCPKCGTKLEKQQVDRIKDSNLEKAKLKEVIVETRDEMGDCFSSKSRLTAALLAGSIGWSGAHNFYLGKKELGILQILLSFLAAISAILSCAESAVFADKAFCSIILFYLLSGIGFYIIDFIIILCGKKKDKDKLYVKDWKVQRSKVGMIIAAVSVLSNFFVLRFTAEKVFEDKIYELSENGNPSDLRLLCFLIHVSKDTKEIALDFAAQGNNGRNLKYLLKKGVNPNNTEAILICSSNGSSENVKELIKAGANVNQKDHYIKYDIREGRTPIMYASANGYLEIVKILIENGADINAKANDGSSAFFLSALHGKTDVMKYLIAQGVNLNDKTERGTTALMGAVEGRNLDAINILLDNGAFIFARDNENNSVFEIAKKNNANDILVLLYNYRKKVYGY